MPARRPGPRAGRRGGGRLLIAASAGVALMVAGLVLSVAATGRAPDATSSSPPVGEPTAVGVQRPAQDAVASSPMPSLPLASATPGPVSTRDPGAPIVLPTCPQAGPAGVATGCPHSREGAMAQLAAIDQSALQSGTMAGARAVIAAWAQPGGPTTTSWSGISAMASLLGDGQVSAGAAVPVVVTPLMGLFKGQVGADFVVPCIDFEFDLTLARTARVGAADCQRMVWNGTRWMIGPGPEPVQSANVWPDTEAAINLGYRDLSWQH
jgi:hypothetical protein